MYSTVASQRTIHRNACEVYVKYVFIMKSATTLVLAAGKQAHLAYTQGVGGGGFLGAGAHVTNPSLCLDGFKGIFCQAN